MRTQAKNNSKGKGRTGKATDVPLLEGDGSGGNTAKGKGPTGKRAQLSMARRNNQTIHRVQRGRGQMVFSENEGKDERLRETYARKVVLKPDVGA